MRTASALSMPTMEEQAAALADAVEAALPGWVERSVRRLLSDPDPAAVEDAGRRAVEEVMPQMRALLGADVDEQRTNPLALLRAAVRYPTDVLRAAGLPPVERDEQQARLLPDDIYDLAPANFADVDPALAEPGMVWGASKAWVHRQRHGVGRP
jgi:hypothetical protein